MTPEQLSEIRHRSNETGLCTNSVYCDRRDLLEFVARMIVIIRKYREAEFKRVLFEADPGLQVKESREKWESRERRNAARKDKWDVETERLIAGVPFVNDVE